MANSECEMEDGVDGGYVNQQMGDTGYVTEDTSR